MIVCSWLGALFQSKKYTPETLANMTVEQLATDIADAGVSIHTKKALFMESLMKFMWNPWNNKESLPVPEEVAGFFGIDLKSTYKSRISGWTWMVSYHRSGYACRPECSSVRISPKRPC